ncbi:MAG TPA: hypothetical protein DEP84_23490 [Chloroflexi bacterium]|nr:hypothetical protein [Chloroflexota bacterium]
MPRRAIENGVRGKRMYLYAITDRPEAPVPERVGLSRASLLSLAYLNIAAVVDPLVTMEVAPTEANLWEHEAVVEALMEDRTVLPVRFGTALADEAAVQAALAARYANLVANLERVRGRVEVGLRVLWGDDPPPATSDTQGRARSGGRAYLLARLEKERLARARRQRAEALAAALYGTLAGVAVESTQQVLITPRLLLTASFLVERDQVATFRREAEALSAVYPALQFLCTGPWPAYSFVTTAGLDVDLEGATG